MMPFFKYVNHIPRLLGTTPQGPQRSIPCIGDSDIGILTIRHKRPQAPLGDDGCQQHRSEAEAWKARKKSGVDSRDLDTPF
jgi:hypothetical protein